MIKIRVEIKEMENGEKKEMKSNSILWKSQQNDKSLAWLTKNRKD